MIHEFDVGLWKGKAIDWIHGNQHKWCENGVWYKEDFPNRPEAAGEFLVTQVLRASNASAFAEYDLALAERNDKPIHLCVSKDFLTDGKPIENFTEKEQESLPILKTAYDILRDHYMEQDTGRHPVGWLGVYNRVTKNMSNKQRIQNFVSVIEEETGLVDFGGYFTQLCELDALVRNVDRHLRNICVVYLPTVGSYGYCPIFDNGASLSSTTPYDYNSFRTPDIDLFIKLKPCGLFGKDFEKIVEDCHELYGPRLQIVNTLDMSSAFQKVEEFYDKETSRKMQGVWNRSKGLHKDLFVDRITQQPINEFFLCR